MKTLRREALCLGSYAAITALATFPVVARVGRAIPGDNDAWQFYWNLWWVKRVLLDLQASPYFTPDLHFPYGASLYFHTLNLFPSILALPIVAAFGPGLAYNCLVFLAFTLSGYGMYRLALYVLAREGDGDGVTSQLSAFIAGLTFTFSSYHFVHLRGHLDLVSTQWLPFFVLFLLKTRSERGWPNPMMCALFLAATVLTSLYYLFFLLVFTSLVLAQIVVSRGPDRWPSFRRVAGLLIAFALIVSPIVGPMLALGRTHGRTPNPAYDIDRFSTDLLAFVVPSSLHPLWGDAVAPLYRLMDRRDSGIETVAFLGYVPLLLAVAGAMGFSAARKFWLAALLLFSALALGPVLHVAGHARAESASIVMPYRLLMRLPYGDIPRGPARFVVMSTLCLSAMAAYGAFKILRGRNRLSALGLTAVVGGLGLAENVVVPFPTAGWQAPPFYDRLGQEASRAGLLEVPIPDDPSVYPRRMLYQTRHGKPVYGGYVSRGLPPLAFDAIPGFSQFKTLSNTVEDVVSYDLTQLSAISRAVLAAYQAGHLVIEKDLMDEVQVTRARQLADALFGSSARVYEDPLTLAYALPAPPPLVPAAIWLDTGWSYLERLQERDAPATRWRWIGERARLGAIASKPTVGRLKIAARAFGRVRRLKLSVGQSEITTLSVSPNRAEYETPRFELTGGTSFLSLESLDGAESPRTEDGRRLSVAFYRIALILDQ